MGPACHPCHYVTDLPGPWRALRCETGRLGRGVEALGDPPIAVVGGVLVGHRRLWARVPEASHELLGGGSGEGGERSRRVAEIVETQAEVDVVPASLRRTSTRVLAPGNASSS